MREKLAPGYSFPDYLLPDHTRTERRLSDLQGQDNPLLLLLIRGHFCPRDREQLKALTAFHPQLVTGGCRVGLISTDDWQTSHLLRQQVGASYPFLCDEKKQVRDELGICEYTDPERLPMIPHTILLLPGLQIWRVWNGHYYWGRPSTDELHSELRSLTRDIRTDWNLMESEVKQRWLGGDVSSCSNPVSEARAPVVRKQAETRALQVKAVG